MSKLRILLADDHHVVREGLRALLDKEPDFCVVGETGDGLGVLPLVGDLRPEAVILDVMLPGCNGLELTRRPTQSFPDTRVIILSMYANDSFVCEALRHGAAAYLVKSVAAVHLIRALREAARGRPYLSPPLSEASLQAYREKMATGPWDSYETLTSREREVLQLAAEGFTNPQIAARLGISTRTVEAHRANLSRKLNLHSLSDLVLYAVRRGIISSQG